MTITRDEVADNARDYARSGFFFGTGQCLKFSRTCAGALGGVFDADAAWANAKFKHRSGVAPRGTFVHWAVGAHGHIAVSDGLGRCYSTDFVRPGRVDLIQIREITIGWGATLRGWTEDVNGVHPLDQEDDMPYTPQELRDALRPMVDNALEAALTAENPALLNAVRVAIEAERAEDAAAVWASPLTNPLTGETQAAGTFLRFATQRLDVLRKWAESVGRAVKATPPA